MDVLVNDITQSLVQQLAKTSPVSTFEAERQSAGQLQLSPGQLVQAEILASLPNNRFLARIAGELFNIELPLILQPGETLLLTMVSDEPRLTFSMSRSENSAIPVSISDTGKWLSMLAQNGISRQQAAAVPRNDIILTGPPADTGLLATLLQNALSMSGVFYESHLVQWFLGERQLKDILKEPQGKLATQAKTPVDGQPSHKAATIDGKEPVEKPEELISFTGPRADNRKTSPEPVEPRTIPIIQDQLHALQSGQISWQGQAWPGQQMEWTVSEREAGTGEKAEKNWHTTLRLSFPNLGEVNATLKLNNEGVHLLIKAGRDSSVAVMREERQDLERAMSDAGVKLLGMVVEHEEHGTGTQESGSPGL
jgi:hypothetical protein